MIAPGRKSTAGLCLAAALVLSVGCRDKPALTPAAGAHQRPARSVRLLVFGDPELARAITLLKAEWRARTGGALEVSEADEDRIGDFSEYHPDAIVYRPAQLGELVAADRILPLPKQVLDSDELAWTDVLPVIRQGVAAWQDAVYAIPFGSPLLTLVYRRDLLKKFDRRPPATWAEYQALADFFSQRDRLGDAAPAHEKPWHGALEPLAPGWAGRTLLARAAAYARHRDNYSTLFNIDNFTPLIAGPPFVRALEELVAAAGPGERSAERALRLDPAEIEAAVAAGECALAITWPSAAYRRQPPAAEQRQLDFAELPGSDEMFNFASQAWDRRTDDETRHVPLLPIAGRLGSAVKGAAAPEEAFRVLSWLSGPEWGTRVGAATSATTLYRKSQAENPAAWLEPGTDPAAAKRYAAAVRQVLERQVWVDGLRIAGWQEYYAALDAAVEQALAGERTAAEALQATAGVWREISARRGIDSQLQAYRHSLGLE